MKAFYITGGAGSLIQLDDGRWADTIGGDTSEAEEAHEALERLYQEAEEAEAKWTEKPLYGDFNLAELEIYANGGDPHGVLTLVEAARIVGLSYRTLQGAAQDGRLETLRDGPPWLTTRQAVTKAVEAGKLRPPKGETEMNASDLYDRFISQASYSEVAHMDVETATWHIQEMRQDEPDDIQMSDREIASVIIEYAKRNTQ